MTSRSHRIPAGDVQLAVRVFGNGPVTVLYIHGNLASTAWIELAAPHFPANTRTIAIDWRGCGDSEKPLPDADFANYSIAQHARDMLAALDTLGVPYCHLATHSTGGIIATRMMLAQPERFGRVFHLSPVGPQGIAFTPRQAAIFGEMKKSLPLTRQIMAATAPSLFEPASLMRGPARLKADAGARGPLFERIVADAFGVSDGIWFGTPHTLTAEHRSGELKARMRDLTKPHLIAWGRLDGIIPERDLREMARVMPDCRFEPVPGIGHSMNVEAPELYARHFGDWFGGLTR